MSECIFCNRANFEDRIIAEDSDWYVIATVGQIVEGYTLLIPKRHVPCAGIFANEGLLGSSRSWTRQAQRALGKEYQCNARFPNTIFEHGIVGQTVAHAHLHLLPTRSDLGERVRMDFPKSPIEKLKSLGHLQERYRAHPMPYLLWSARERTPYPLRVCWNPPAPPQYLRLILAERLGIPERGNWRFVDPDQDKWLCECTVRRLRPYF